VGRVARNALPDGFFHVYARGVPGAGALYRDDEDRLSFIDIFWRVAGREGWTCYALCLMSTHYHVVVESTRERLSAGMERLNGEYARSFNRKHGRFGHVFAERFSTRVVEEEQYLFEVCAYVTLNPVRAGLCARADEWPWSWSAYGRCAS
jgi:REP element-mobilizing transposase RayT